jgi:hypothetical protein
MRVKAWRALLNVLGSARGAVYDAQKIRLDDR